MKECGKCGKTVYPTEELKCLDKVWHKACFKCQVCSMALNMKNYKGYDKMPYCNAHYPQTKHTAIADTPDMKRVQENTKIQSNIKYHEDFEKEKGKYHLVTDDPVTLRAKQTMQTISNVEYHQVRERRESQEMRRPAEQVTVFKAGSRNNNAFNPAGQVKVRRDPGRIADYDPEQAPNTGGGTPYSSRSSANMVYDSKSGRDSLDQRNYREQNRVQRFSSSGDEDQMETSQTRRVGSISDYDPVNDRYGSIVGQYNPDPRKEPPAPLPSHSAPQPYQPPHHPPPQQYQPPPPQSPRGSGKGLVCQALYDYSAADEDEVSFAEGDTIVFCQPIDQGWMEGTVERTGQRGMLPSNYVERVN
ncbi:hypothetical protein CHS0354_004978 [Potamilus streckersoni]|uniref:Uncharacterized protein n=1 Tax=Potamilus streckersoni TaxID=2493646 RepID=A0AAE0W0S5_9BIVA|nr:hypothetical protein CHS0354_004978 [Potamilus streckersoni]